MAASANPSANDENSRHGAAPPPSNNGNSAAETSGQPTPAGLRHNPGISTDWSADEQSMLDELLIKHASEPSIVRYAKIAMRLKDKTVRDVAFRCRWMTKKENGKRRKEDHSTTRRNKEKKEKGTDTSARPTSHSARPSGPMYVPPMMPMDNEDGISFKAIGGVTGQLLEQNAQIFSQISANLSAFQLHENINLLCQTRDNIVSILNNSNDMPDIMKQMPPLTEKINEELANSILPRMTHHMKS
uniref:Myb-like domain-containing protein n=1 Tax=Kalanchoe fedtschenkoi TaxID=63787 RepID=A0A7N1A2I1_KALFE